MRSCIASGERCSFFAIEIISWSSISHLRGISFSAAFSSLHFETKIAVRNWVFFNFLMPFVFFHISDVSISPILLLIRSSHSSLTHLCLSSSMSLSLIEFASSIRSSTSSKAYSSCALANGRLLQSLLV